MGECLNDPLLLSCSGEKKDRKGRGKKKEIEHGSDKTVLAGCYSLNRSVTKSDLDFSRV